MQLQYAQRTPAQNVSTRRNGPRPETRPIVPRPRHIAPRPRGDLSRIGQRIENFVRDETETLVRLETVSRSRRLDRDHIPGDTDIEGLCACIRLSTLLITDCTTNITKLVASDGRGLRI